MNGEIQARARRLALRIRVRSIASISVVALLVVGGLVIFFGSKALNEREALQSVKVDYQATWCNSFGAAQFDTTVFEEWYLFVDRHREFLQAEPMLMTTIDTGEQRLILEYELDWSYDVFVTNGPQPDFQNSMKSLVPGMFWSTHELLALGENEFEKKVPLPCE